VKTTYQVRVYTLTLITIVLATITRVRSAIEDSPFKWPWPWQLRTTRTGQVRVVRSAASGMAVPVRGGWYLLVLLPVRSGSRSRVDGLSVGTRDPRLTTD
jgi:hypothetical protein